MADPRTAKRGLALSGGGFRAALFHLGALARLAELGALRSVEVLSTVSGGSIIGALYYLHVKRLLERKPDSEIADGDYVELVRAIESTFLATIEKNIRARTFGDLRKNFRMARLDYSRSDRVGELYDDLFLRPAWHEPRLDPIQMRELKIEPAGAPRPFDPDEDNATRMARVPVLLVNATTLNTGHNWRFEAVRMGEPPLADAAAVDVDKNTRLLRAYYRDLPEEHARITLGKAVAASAAVPSVFHPLPLIDLLPGFDVQLVDGGTHDNQGVQGLIDRDCTDWIVSDASHQLVDRREPPTRIAAVLGRATDVLGDRLREEQLLRRLREAPRTTYVHLRKGLPAPVVHPEGAAPVPPAAEPAGAASWGIHPDVQHLLALVRTDLDSFTEVEGYSLMLAAYLMTGAELEAEAVPPRRGWSFLAIGDLARDPPPAYLRHLRAAARRFSKALALRGLGGFWAFVLGMLAPLVGAGLVIASHEVRVPLWAVFSPLAAGLLLAAAYLSPRPRIPVLSRLTELLATRAAPAALAPLFRIWAFVTLTFVNPTFVRLGRLETLRRELR